MSDNARYDPWAESELLLPSVLAAQLKTFDPARHIVYVGSASSYKSTHIPRAVLGGPANKQRGLDLLTEAVKKIPRDAEIVIYCGCCPFVRCPNIRPAYRALKEMGYLHIKVVQMNTNLRTDWIGKSYPVELSTN